MPRSPWEKLADDLLAQDRWGDFDVARTQETPTGPPSRIWRQAVLSEFLSIDPHPVDVLVNSGVPPDHFEAYVPCLVRALDEVTADMGLEMVVRALTKKGTTVATEKLLRLYANEELVAYPGLLWAVGNAICTIAPCDHWDECICICRNRRLGRSRHMLVVHLSRFKKSEEVFQTLLSLLDDESVRGPALEALKRFGDIRAIPAIERTPVRGPDEPYGNYETHQKMMALKKLSEKKNEAAG
ncbi:MAG: HEAT repeat domain-containing protein [Planctomycetes bacterium]|nr:HEAT repeat domain-containing protein [Planctomycetota bacterium]